MKKLITAFCLLALFAACQKPNDAESMGQGFLAQARDYLSFARFSEARAAIDSIRIKYPLAFNAREEGILLLDSIDIAQARDMLQKSVKALALGPKGARRDSVEFDRDESSQKITFYTKKLAHDKANFKKH